MLSTLLAVSALSMGATPHVFAGQEGIGNYWEVVSIAQNERPRVDSVLPRDEIEAQLERVMRESELPGLLVEEEESLAAIGEMLALLTDLPVLVTQAAEEAVMDEGILFDIELAQPIAVDDLVSLIARLAGEEVAWSLREGAIVFDVRDRGQECALFVHSVLDFLVDAEAFGDSPTGRIGPFSPIEPDTLQTLIYENVAPATWEMDGRAIYYGSGFMSVIQTPDVQREIESFLDELRAFFVPLPDRGLPGMPRTIPTRSGNAKNAEVRRQLEQIRISAAFGEGGEPVTIHEVARFLSQICPFNVLVHPQVMDELDEEATRVRFSAGNSSVLEVLARIELVTEDLGWRVIDGAVEFVPRWIATSGNYLALRDVRPLIGAVDPHAENPEPAVLSGDDLVQLIFESVSPSGWDDDPTLSVQVLEQGVLVIKHDLASIEQVDRLLGHLQELADLKHRVLAEKQSRDR